MKHRITIALAGRFFRDRRGNFALLSALAMLPLMMAVGFGIDIARLMDVKTELSNAADAAVLAAIAEGSQGKAAAYSMSGYGEIPAGEKEAEIFFRANLLDVEDVVLSSTTAKVIRENGRLVSMMEYEADVSLAFGGLLGMEAAVVRGRAEAAVDTGLAMDFYLLLDNTPSMGVGATKEDINTLVANTPDNCAFACHENNGNNYYELAKELGVQMRIDLVRQAAQKLAETAEKTRQYADQFRIAAYSFGKNAGSRKLTRIANLSSDTEQVKSSLGKLDLMMTPKQNFDNDQLTSFDENLADLNKAISNPGSGLKGAEPQKIVFFVSDGVGDSYKPGTCTEATTGTGRCQEPIDTIVCDAIKARGIKIAVLYTTYLPLPDNAWYRQWIDPFQGKIAKRMEACATPGLYFEVSPSEGIPEAMQALFLKTLSTLRLLG